MEKILTELGAFLADSGVDWAVCGGWALELFLGRETRVHGDLDLSVPEAHRERIQRFMLERGWLVYEFRGQGRLRPLSADVPSEPGRNLMCLRAGCELVTFWPCDEPDMVLHEWHSAGIRELNYMEFLFRERPAFFGRSPDRAIIRAGGLPYLAPEVVLRYKAAEPERAANRADFAAAFPALSPERRGWLMDSLRGQYAGGHPWLAGEETRDA